MVSIRELFDCYQDRIYCDGAIDVHKSSFDEFMEIFKDYIFVPKSIMEDPPEDCHKFIALQREESGVFAEMQFFIQDAINHGFTHWIPVPNDVPEPNALEEWYYNREIWANRYNADGFSKEFAYKAFEEACPKPAS